MEDFETVSYYYFFENSNELLQSRPYYLIRLILDTQTATFFLALAQIFKCFLYLYSCLGRILP